MELTINNLFIMIECLLIVLSAFIIYKIVKIGIQDCENKK